ncbi:MFS transporter [Kitasatospora purpeofusca]|uniref:MFS transporter n=1 Tax=Kitasatospora purpeofusca TaxID=67352 RepID=A0ABZ1UAC5_9ACTN|nr:MFS transporter [Kitasatospora purpeofusca]
MRILRAVRSFPLPVRLLLVNQLGVNTGFYLLIPYLAGHLGHDLGLSALAVGTVLGLRNLSQQGLFILGGSAADRLGARRVIIAGCALRSVGFGLFALGDTLGVLLAASALSGLAGALFNPAVRTYVAREAADRKAEAFALFSVFATTGALAGPLIGTVLLLVDFRAAALTAAGVFAVLTVAQAFALPERAAEPAPRGVLADWREVASDRRFLAFSLGMVGLFGMESQLYLLLPDAARRATGWEGAVSLVFLTATLANLTLQLRITTRLQRHGPPSRWIPLGLAVAATGFLLPLAAPGLPGVLGGVLLLQLGLMTAQPFVLALIPAFGRDSLTGTYYGLYYVVSGFAAALGNTLVGRAMDSAATAPWLLCAGLGLASATALARLHRTGRLPAPARPLPSEAR